MSRDTTPTILVVNDDQVQLHLTAAQLERDGMRVVRCTCVEEALGALNTEASIDAIVTDLHMPGIDGWRFCRLLRSPEYVAFNHIPILVVSATFCGADAEQDTVDLGAIAFLPVPYEPAALRDSVRNLLTGQVPQASPHVLIVEELVGQPSALQGAFEGHRYTVQVAGSREDGALYLQVETPEVVILDYDLPDLSDHRLLEALKRPGSSTVVLIITRDPSPTKAVESMRKGADGYVRKPYDPEYVIALCERARRERAFLRVEELLDERTKGLRDSEARFRSLVEGIDEIIVVCDHRRIIQYVNKVGAQRLAWTPQELIGKPRSTILAPESISTPVAPTPTQDGRDDTPVVLNFSSRTGHRIQVEVSEQPIVFNGEPATMMVARDVTERKRAELERAKLEDQLRQAQKMEAIGTLAGGVAHDFNNLLTVILGHVQLLKMRTESNDETYHELGTIETAVYRAKALTEQLLGFARRGKHQNILVDLRTTIREVGAFLSRTFDKKIVLREELGVHPATVTGDPNQLHQVILNLSVNARDAMPHGGMITYRTEVVRPERELRQRVPGMTADEYVMVSVSDTGSGIPEHLHTRIFEPFFTTKDARSGTGMGLAMVYGIVKNHGGAIEVESVVGRGSTFKLYLPLSTQSDGQVESQREGTPVAGGGKILLVDDEELVRNIAARLLNHLGYEVVMASSGKEAEEYYRKHWPDLALVILDMIMPEMNGRECFRALRSINPDVKVVLITGYDKNLAVQEVLDEGVQGFVQKPFDLNRFSRVIAQVLNPHLKPGLAPSR